MPRQARDTDRRRTGEENERRFFLSLQVTWRSSACSSASSVVITSSGNKTRVLKSTLHIRMFSLPRQARDKRWESTQKRTRFLILTLHWQPFPAALHAYLNVPYDPAGGCGGRKIFLGRHFIPKMNMLPRQARDKHRKCSRKEWRFRCSPCSSL